MALDPLAAAIAAAADEAVPIVFKARDFVPGRYVLVDGDYLVYTTCGNDETPIGDARVRLMQKLDDFKQMAGAEFVIVHLTATGSHKGWRYVIATQTPYQGQREGSRRPKNWEQLRDFVESYSGPAFRQKIWGTREADDGINLHQSLLPYGKAVVAMKDKDSQMFTGCIHMDWDTFELTEVPKHTYEMENSVGRLFGTKWFWLQLLMGDAADKIPGLPKILSHTGKTVDCGPARALDALCMSHDDSGALDIVCKHYAFFYKEAWAERLVEQMGLLWMRGDQHAAVDDFMSIIPPDHKYWEHLRTAADQLLVRVKEVRDATPDY